MNSATASATANSATANSATVNRASPRLRMMTRKEFWTQIGLSLAGWVMFVALARIWWRVYLVGERLLGG